MSDPNRQTLPPPARHIGDIVVIAFNDGILPTTVDCALGIDLPDAERMSGFRSGEKFFLHVNEYVLKIEGRTILIDAGSGDNMYPTLGRLPGNLRAGGVDPLSVDAILMTHLHPDHMHGLVDNDGAPVFPNAELILHETEAAFWIGKQPTGDPRIDKNLPHVERNTRPYRSRMRLVGSGEALPGVRAHLCPGHTPGHTAWVISSRGETGIMWGDLVHLQNVQFARPEVAVSYDLDGAQAARSRKETFALCARGGWLVLGAHLDFPGFGRLTRAGDAYGIDPA
jgi:glyoxylase-like metal-dependent hydrolase (beta-lactamase superfamily II)